MLSNHKLLLHHHNNLDRHLLLRRDQPMAHLAQQISISLWP
jgi:hypothetical protein